MCGVILVIETACLFQFQFFLIYRKGGCYAYDYFICNLIRFRRVVFNIYPLRLCCNKYRLLICICCVFWVFLGFMIGLGLSILISRFVAHKYPRLEEKMCVDYPKAEAEIEVKESKSPHFIISCPERASFGVCLQLFYSKPHHIFIVPEETMIKKDGGYNHNNDPQACPGVRIGTEKNQLPLVYLYMYLLCILMTNGSFLLKFYWIFSRRSLGLD